MRNVINKYVTHEELLDTAREIHRRDWRTIGLYFMIGHPQEEMSDVAAIVDLSRQVLAEGRRFHNNKAAVNVGVSTFIPSPHTPSSGKPKGEPDDIRDKLRYLAREFKQPGLVALERPRRVGSRAS